MIEITYKVDKKAFILDLNSIPEEISVSDTSNYNFMLDGKKLGIQLAHLTGEMQVTLVLEESAADLVSEYSDEMSSKLSMSTKNIRDLKNRELDKDNNATVFQFRELFVQKIFPTKVAPKDGEFIHKTVPLLLVFPNYAQIIAPSPVAKGVILVSADEVQSFTWSIKGMTCDGCEIAVENEVNKLHGIIAVDAIYAESAVNIKFDKTKTTPESIEEAISKTGYMILGKK